MGWEGPLTHRQALAWQEWLAEEWHRPDRGDHYLMQLNETVKHILDTESRYLDIGKSRIRFKRPEPREETDPDLMTPEQRARAGAYAKMRIASMYGVALPGMARLNEEGVLVVPTEEEAAEEARLAEAERERREQEASLRKIQGGDQGGG